jgi:ferredoxin
MDRKIKKHPLNAKGEYYVDQESCTFSGNCIVIAADHFEMDAEYRVRVIKQPITQEEHMRCQRAMQECPVAAIRDDGEIKSAT